MNTYSGIRLLAGTASQELAREISDYLQVPICDHEVIEFPNENLFVRLRKSVRGQDVYIIQTTSSPVHRNLMELLITLQTLKLDSAGRITAVVPYLCYARSDKKDQPRVPITARLVADLVQVAGADRYMVLDLHAGQIQGFFSIPGDALTAFHMLSGYFVERRETLRDPVIVAADLGYSKKGRNFAARLDCSMAFIEKRRRGNDPSAEALTIVGEVAGHDVIVVDDEVATGGSVIQAVELIKAHGASEVYLSFVHPVFSADAVERLAGLPVKQIVTTNTIPLTASQRALLGERLVVLSVAPLLGEVIRRAHEGRSVGEMFNE